ncbi:tetratricopeptide repeat protein [Mucilaginibacter rubeus]|uniref:Tetratricopeptide repeat protein n=1 Tax=Mucilaginibacter rubeus TaxID=2027860 RepID=A0AAE6MLV5_9SPHI|nr:MULTISPECIES: tetratricopeptide repeat protein [Mucilaginibacter]QEM07642.1 tetratricopeptide repeat protein [Mucilaginibacter rubeus]QEM20096.1 tetratricopeptide repeat protein [Mucilaginibacter gossypii]QTE43192.1 tetratricopeptide repeat protein [Mucilaginibacter rubeus]QTE49792.1 tetratricopeptide repeat protein [Mucilaginibacter rubeus]QTE54885.1 tetratricopeptide repeat protein [Mucilaginibacter rubeus]
MHYINPFNLLSIQADSLSEIDSSTIRKAKKILLANIELSDNEAIDYNGVEITKSACLSIIDELDDKNKKEFHFFIFKNLRLNDFLFDGDLDFFRYFKIESIYALPEFIAFISPYFSLQFDKSLSKNFKKQNFSDVKLLLSIKPIVHETYLEKIYNSTYIAVKDVESEIIQIIKDIENKTSPYIKLNFNGLPDLVNRKVNIELVNILPAYFNTVRNQLAQTIRNLARDLNNEPFEQYKAAFEIIEIAYSIVTDGLVKQTVTKGYFIIKKNNDDNIHKQVKTVSQPIVKPNHIEIVDAQPAVEKPKKNSDGIIYWVFVCCAFAAGFFYAPIQAIILALSLITMIFPVFALYKDKDFSILSFLKRNLILIAAAGLGFFYPIIAQLFISYNFLLYLKILYDKLTYKKKENKNRYAFYLIGALVITFIYNYSLKSSNNLVVDKDNNSVIVLSAEDYFQKGQSLFSNSNYSDAIPAYDSAIKKNPNYADAFLARGASKANLGHYNDAIIDYLKAQKFGLNSSILFSNLGFSNYQLKQIDTANKYLQKALSLDSTNANAYRWIGDIKYDKNDNKGAADEYTKAINYNGNASNYFARGLAFYYLKNYVKAIQDMDKAIELNPNVGQYYYDRGDTKEMINDNDGACNDWKIAKVKGYDVPDYKVNKCTPQIISVPDGEIAGCNGIRYRYNRELNNRLLITVGGNACVAVKLINFITNKCIRYVFINKNSTYSIKNIPEGKYYLKIAYGDDWSIMGGQSNCIGRFTRNSIFEKGQDILDYNILHEGRRYQIPSFSLKLNIDTTGINNNTFNTNKINETDFYNE